MPPSRRDILAALTATIAGGIASKARAQPEPRKARIITDERASSFDIGPQDAGWRVFVGLPRMPAPADGYSAIIATDGNASFPGLWDRRRSWPPTRPWW